MLEKQSETENKKEEPSSNGELSVAKVALGSKTLAFYFNLIKFPLIFAVVLGGVYFFTTKAVDFTWFIDLVALGYVAVVVLKKHQGKAIEVIIANGLAGFFIGFFNALFKLILYRKFYLVFNLISEPVLTALVGIFVGLAIGYSFFNLLKNKKVDSSKERR